MIFMIFMYCRHIYLNILLNFQNFILNILVKFILIYNIFPEQWLVDLITQLNSWLTDCSMATNYLRPWLETTMLHFGSLNPLKSFLSQLHNTSHKISQRWLSLYINQIYPLIADICLRQDFQIYKMTVLALIFRNEPYFPSVSKR